MFGEQIKRSPSIGGHDGAFMCQADISTVVYGLGGGSQHDPSMVVDTWDLYIEIDELYNVAKTHSLSCLEVCSTPKS